MNKQQLLLELREGLQEFPTSSAFLRHINVVQIPIIRLIGFSFLTAGIIAHNYFFLNDVSWQSALTIVALFMGYSLVSWGFLRLLYSTIERLDLGLFFIVVDIIFFVLGVYFSGGEKSWVFFIVIMHVVDQTHTSFGRLLFLTHCSILFYSLLLLYMGFIEHRDLVWSVEILKVLIVYAAGMYISISSRGALRNRTLRIQRLTRQLQDARKKAEEASRAKSLFLANMSHELRTPLNAIIGFANVLLKRKIKELEKDDVSFLERIVANGKLLLILISDILDFTKLEATRPQLHVSTISLEALINDAAFLLQDTPANPGVRLRVDIPPTVAPIEADENKLKQVLINLISNSLKFTERGEVVIRVSVEPATHRPVRIDVSDTGIGIAEERHQVIFEAFQQADNLTSRKYGGTGLGLTISRLLCDMMGYRLEMKSEIGKGSMFSVILN